MNKEGNDQGLFTISSPFLSKGEKSTTSSSCLLCSLTLIFKPWKANSFKPRTRKRICKWPSLLESTGPSLAKTKQSFLESLLLSQCITQLCRIQSIKEKETPWLRSQVQRLLGWLAPPSGTLWRGLALSGLHRGSPPGLLTPSFWDDFFFLSLWNPLIFSSLAGSDFGSVWRQPPLGGTETQISAQIYSLHAVQLCNNYPSLDFSVLFFLH